MVPKMLTVKPRAKRVQSIWAKRGRGFKEKGLHFQAKERRRPARGPGHLPRRILFNKFETRKQNYYIDESRPYFNVKWKSEFDLCLIVHSMYQSNAYCSFTLYFLITVVFFISVNNTKYRVWRKKTPVLKLRNTR